MRLTLWPCHSNGATARLTDICRLSSSGSKSVVVLPSSTEPMRVIAPARNSRASLSVVFPAPPCENRPTLRSCAGAYSFMGGNSSRVEYRSQLVYTEASQHDPHPG